MSKTSKIIARLVSDADVLIKLARTAHLELLGATVGQVLVPRLVFDEARSKVNKPPPGLTLLDARNKKWFAVMDTLSAEDFTLEQRRAMNSTRQSFEYMLDDGELEALVLAVELGVPYILSDDRKAREIIERESAVRVLRHPDLIVLCQQSGLACCREAEQIFEEIQQGESYPLGAPFSEIARQSVEYLTNLGLLR